MVRHLGAIRMVDNSMNIFDSAAQRLQSPFLLLIRLYWGWQFIQTGWAKVHNIGKVCGYFATLGIPAPALTAHFIAGLELVGGLLLVVGLVSRFTGLLLAGNMFVAYVVADREALFAVLSDPDKFSAAAPFTFLLASLIVLIFGAGQLSLDARLGLRSKDCCRP